VGSKGAMQPTPVSSEFRTAVENAVRVAAALFTSKPLSHQIVKSVHASQQFMRVAFHWAAAYTNELRRQLLIRTGSTVASTPSERMSDPHARIDTGRDRSVAAGEYFSPTSGPAGGGFAAHASFRAPVPALAPSSLHGAGTQHAAHAHAGMGTGVGEGVAVPHDVHTCTAYLPTVVARPDGYMEHAMQPFPVAVLVTPAGCTVLHTLPAMHVGDAASPRGVSVSMATSMGVGVGMGAGVDGGTALAPHVPSPSSTAAHATTVAAAQSAQATPEPHTATAPSVAIDLDAPAAAVAAGEDAVVDALSPATSQDVSPAASPSFGDVRADWHEPADTAAVPLPPGWSGCVLDHCQVRVAGVEDMGSVWGMVRALAEFEREPDGVRTTAEMYVRDGCGSAPLFHVMLVEVPTALYDAMASHSAAAPAGASTMPTATSAATAAGAGSATHPMWGDWRPVAMALCHLAYSTWEGRVLYLEDLYVVPCMRRHGVSHLLFETLARAAYVAHCARMQWSVLHWNSAARRLYEHPRIGATPLTEWGLYRLTSADLARIAELGHAVLE